MCATASFPVRAFLQRTRFVEAAVRSIDLEHRVVHLSVPGENADISYDQLVLALGAMTNRVMIPGSKSAFTFKTLADALLLRNHVIERFELADVEADPERKRRLLTFVIVGGGLVGVELCGELTAFADGIVPLYKNLNRGDVHFVLLQGGDRIMPEIDPALAAYGAGVLAKRPGVHIRTNTHVQAIEPGRVLLRGAGASGAVESEGNHGAVHLADETIEADTIILAAGIVPNPLVVGLPVATDKRGHVVVDGTMRCQSKPSARADSSEAEGYERQVWAIGDCASIPAPDGKPYPNLAQHALRESKALAKNLFAVLNGQPPQPFVYDTLGMMGSLGHGKAFGQLLKVRVHGMLAWFIRRTYYLLQMPGWGRRLRIMTDWTFALLFRPDVVKISLDSEEALWLRELGDEQHHDEDSGFSEAQVGAARPADVGRAAGFPRHGDLTAPGLESVPNATGGAL